MYYLDSYVANQATAGLEGVKLISLMYRNQWKDQAYTPRSFNLQYSSPLKSIQGAYGLSFYNRLHGVLSHNGVKTSYNQVFPSKNYLLSGGLGIQYDWINLDFKKIRTPEGTYVGTVVSHNDPILNNAVLTQQSIALTFALYLQSKALDAGLEYGLPILHFRPSGARILTSENILKLYLFKEFRLERWTFRATVLNLSDFIQNQEELRIDIRYLNQYSAGVFNRGFRRDSWDAYGAQFAFHLSAGIWLSYQFEIPVRTLVSKTFGATQQFGLKFDLKARDPKSRYPIIYNPRW